jgi:hypothetical protein
VLTPLLVSQPLLFGYRLESVQNKRSHARRVLGSLWLLGQRALRYCFFGQSYIGGVLVFLDVFGRRLGVCIRVPEFIWY